jgi:putative heme-binding domain-containing protein
VLHEPLCSLFSWLDARWPLSRELVARRLAELDKAEFCLDWLQGDPYYKDSPAAADILRGIQIGLNGRKQVPMPEHWREAFEELSASPHEAVRDRTMQLAVLFGDKKAIAQLMSSVRETQAKPEKRVAALELLLQKQLPELLPILRTLVGEPAMRGAAVRGLASFNAADTPELILKHYANLTEAEKSDAIQTLASRPAYASALLDAVEKGTVQRKDISPFIARQIVALKNPQLSQKLEKVWGVIRLASKERAALTAKYKAILTSESLKKADFTKGKAVFAKNCASCHKLYGEGGAIGPELTGSQRNNLDYILENVIDPSAVVAREYTVTNIDLKNGRTVSGIIAQETERALTVQTPNEKLIIAKSDIETRTQTNVSMMPEGLFDKMAEDEVRDLVAFLMRK